MADGDVTVECGEDALVEGLRHEAHVLHHGDVLGVADGDAGRLLTPVLEGVQAQIREVGHGLAWCEHTEDAALFTRLVDGDAAAVPGLVQGAHPLILACRETARNHHR